MHIEVSCSRTIVSRLAVLVAISCAALSWGCGGVEPGSGAAVTPVEIPLASPVAQPEPAEPPSEEASATATAEQPPAPQPIAVPKSPPTGSGPWIEIQENASPADVGFAKQLFKDGLLAYESGDYNKAARLFSQGYKLSGMPALLYNQARAMLNQNKTDEACDILSLLLEHDAQPGSEVLFQKNC